MLLLTQYSATDCGHCAGHFFVGLRHAAALLSTDGNARTITAAAIATLPKVRNKDIGEHFIIRSPSDIAPALQR
jgi:hypothetical protein